ncbi:MAG TPA: hypothetical protein VFT50_06320 [Baekduia sp.]|nr:hypothetical protein [Baekduia sp.]
MADAPDAQLNDRPASQTGECPEPAGAATAALGAYGLRLTGLEAQSAALVPVPAGAPAYALSSELGDVGELTEHLSAAHAELRVPSGARIHIDRAAGRIRVRTAQPVRPEALVHPYLASAAAIIARWHGHESFHAGAIAVDGGAWALLADREGGKSSTLAQLAVAGVPIVCDDMLVLDGERPLPGPRTLDLRTGAAERFPHAEPLGSAGARDRWRLRVGSVADDLRLRGFVVLAWGDAMRLRPLTPRERLDALLRHRGVRLAPADPGALLDYAGLPAWELSRPRTWSSMDAAAGALLERVSA